MTKNGAVGYARVSTEEQARENNSLPAQRHKITTYCEQNGIPLLKVFEESSSARTMFREQLHTMLEFCREHRSQISCLVISDLSRLARNVADQGTIILRLQALGIKLASIDEPLTDDSALGKFLRNQLGSANQLFSDMLSEKTRDRMQSAVKAGRFVWGAPIGYLNVDKKLKVDPVRGPLVTEAFKLIDSGRFPTADGVLKLVTTMGLKTKKGNVLTKQTFARMISNPIYAGWVVSGDLKAEGTHEPLVSQELFDRVQQRLKKKPGAAVHKKVNEDFPLRGIVRCAKCGKPLTAGWAKGKYPRYWCYTPKCHSVGISRDDLHRHFKSLLGMMQPTAQFLAELPQRIRPAWQARVERISEDQKRLQRRLTEQTDLNKKAIELRVKGEISAEDLETFKATTGEEILRIQAALNDLNSEKGTMDELLKQAEAEATDLVAAWDKGGVNERQTLATAFFPDGLVFSHQLKFFEPANTVITDMFMRYLTDPDRFGVPDGI